MKHKFKPEKTNGGNYFSDCSCGATLGVYPDWTVARDAHKAHKEGREPEGKVPTYVLWGPPIQGQGDS